MKRNYPIAVMSPVLDQDLIRQIVFHEAGHAAAIHLYNKQKQLPRCIFKSPLNKPITLTLILSQTELSHVIILSRWLRMAA